MKKFLSLTLVLAMLAAMLCIPTFAAKETLEGAGSQDIDVYLELNGSVQHKYSVDIDYDSMTFIYNASGFKWNISENGYSYSYGDSDWTTDTQTVKITNHSDMPIKYTVTMETVEAYDALTFELSNPTKNLPACTPDTTYGSNNGTVGVTVSGDLPADAVDGAKMGILKVKIELI